ncbi:MAG: hypothetical protein COZ59_03825 [Bacteroidetes bacterium CG_4_8_14_3_um_filter_31_14]|nr:MAG: hypothetical protein COZ59_03825 [Bacteroidetes bacterium CG_4_8_14_3_um_filter_31_14]
MKNTLLFLLIVSIFIISCDKLAKEDTPVCKDCYQMKFKNNLPKDTLKYQRLCGGDVVVWENIPDSNSVVDTTVVQFFCK